MRMRTVSPFDQTPTNFAGGLLPNDVPMVSFLRFDDDIFLPDLFGTRERKTIRR